STPSKTGSASSAMSSLWASNQASAPVSGVAGPKAALLHDPQTAGGLLASVAQADVAHLLKALENAGYTAAQIGQITPPGKGLSARASL
ncbi:MAG: bifunctional NADH dehydrogenase FAD-containing subunit/selenide, water dikinase SelD, partial [Pseudomonadota bacterium]